MCARTSDVEVLARTPDLNQSDHNWMMQNQKAAYDTRLDMINDAITNIDAEIKSVVEINAGKYGIFGRLLYNQKVSQTLLDYRLFDEHYDCLQNAITENLGFRAQRPDVSFNTRTLNIWEYEDVVPYMHRYKSDVSILHYISNMPSEHITNAIFQICRVTLNHIIIVDYPPDQGRVDIVQTFVEENPDTEVSYQDNIINDDLTETIYYITHR